MYKMQDVRLGKASQTRIFRREILHTRFEAVLKAAAAGCRLCRFVADGYAKANFNDEVKGYHWNCAVAVGKMSSFNLLEKKATEMPFELFQPDDSSEHSLPTWSSWLRNPNVGFKHANPKFQVCSTITVPIRKFTFRSSVFGYI